MKNILNILFTTVSYLFNAPYNGLIDFKKYVSNNIKNEDDLEDKFITSFSKYDLILIEHRGLKIIGTTIDYELSNIIKVKSCYFFNSNIRPILVTKDNTKEFLGDIRLFVSKYEEELLHISREIKTNCVLTIINIFNMAKEEGLSLTKENLSLIIKHYKYKLQVLEHSWN
jgi:hypothetical protein